MDTLNAQTAFVLLLHGHGSSVGAREHVGPTSCRRDLLGLPREPARLSHDQRVHRCSGARRSVKSACSVMSSEREKSKSEDAETDPIQRHNHAEYPRLIRRLLEVGMCDLAMYLEGKPIKRAFQVGSLLRMVSTKGLGQVETPPDSRGMRPTMFAATADVKDCFHRMRTPRNRDGCACFSRGRRSRA